MNYFGNIAKDIMLEGSFFFLLTFTQKFYYLNFQKMVILMFLKWIQLKRMSALSTLPGDRWKQLSVTLSLKF